MSLVYSKRAKCMGCLALKKLKIGGVETYNCSLNFLISYVQVKEMAISPSPKEKCLKPKTKDELDEAKARKEAA